MAQRTDSQNPRDVLAEAVVERAMEGELVKIGEYKMRERKGEALIKQADILVNNSDAEPGDSTHDVYGALSDGFAVIDLDGVLEDGE